MAIWLGLNLALGALFVVAIVGIPLWLVIARPDRAPAPAQLPAWRQPRERRARELAPARQRTAGARLHPVPDN